MLVHNEEDEDRDIKETFQSVFKPFWAGVPVVNDLLLHIKLLSDNFFITVKNVESVLKPTASPSLSWSLSQFPCFMKWLVVLLLPLGDGVLVHYKVTPMLWLSLIILIKLFQVTWHLHFFASFSNSFFFILGCKGTTSPWLCFIHLQWKQPKKNWHCFWFTGKFSGRFTSSCQVSKPKSFFSHSYE